MLLVDDEPGIRSGIRRLFEAHDIAVDEAADCATALELFRDRRPDCCLADYMLPDGTALDLLPRLQAIDPDLPVVVITAHGSIDLAVRALKLGAENFVTKPIDLPALTVIVERAVERYRARRSEAADRSRARRSQPDPFLGDSAAIRRLRDECERVVGAEAPLLLLGETGVGKGVLARWLHDHGPRAGEPFVDLNCAGLVRDFLETELFGHQRGAFTGAVSNRQGLLEIAHKGSVFLDEIGDMDPRVQPKLLKVLEEKRFRRLGESRDLQVDVRLIAATHQNLQHLVRDGRFRQDLYFRISTVPLEVPPLRQRGDDVLLLAERFLAELAPGRDMSLADDAREALRRYSWPGNIRELRNVVERAVLLARSPRLGRRDLRFEAETHPLVADDDAEPQQRRGAGDLAGLTLEQVEIAHIRAALDAEEGNVSRAAARLDVPRSTLYQKLKRFGIERPGC